MPYNLTNMSQNVTGILSLTQNVNDTLMFGWLGTLFLIGVAVIILGSFIFVTGDTKKSVAATAFLTFMLALFLKAIGLIPNIAIFITLIVAAAALAVTWKKG